MLFAADVRAVQVIPSELVITMFSAPPWVDREPETATNVPLP